jgi:hypothetical protein
MSSIDVSNTPSSSEAAAVKGHPYTHEMVNESIAREQGGLAHFASRPGEVLVHEGAESKRNFHLLSLSRSSHH